MPLPFFAALGAGALAGGVGAAGSAIGRAVAGSTPLVSQPNIDGRAFEYGGPTPEQRDYSRAVSTPGSRTMTAPPPGLPPALQEAWRRGDLSRTRDERAEVEALRQRAQDAPSMFQREIDRNDKWAMHSQERQGVQANLDAYNRSRSAFDAGQGAVDTGMGNMGQAVDLYRQAAMGNGPSAAQMQLQQGLDANNRAAASMAAGARGGGGNLALAARGAMNTMAQNNQQAAQQSGMLRAQEMQQAMQGFAGASQAQTSAAMQSRAQQLQAAGMDAQTAFQQAALEDQQRGRNDAMQQFFENQRRGVMNTQFGAGMERERMNSDNAFRWAQLNAGIDAGNRGMTMDAFNRGFGAIGSGLGAGFSMMGG